MNGKPDERPPSDVVRAMEAEREAARRVEEARREAAALLSEAREDARRIRARGEALVKRMSRIVSDRAARDVVRIKREHEAELAELESSELSGPAYRKAAAGIAAALLGLGKTPPGEA